MDKTILSLNWNAELLVNVGHTECHHGAIVSVQNLLNFLFRSCKIKARPKAFDQSWI